MKDYILETLGDILEFIWWWFIAIVISVASILGALTSIAIVMVIIELIYKIIC